MTNDLIYGIIFLPVICLIGIVTSHEDARASKIRNKWVFLGLGYALVVYGLCWAARGAVTFRFLPQDTEVAIFPLLWNFDKWAVNLTVSTVAAFLLWRYKLWAAGDAKLFIAYAALIPMGKYPWVYCGYYLASLLLLMAIFIPATLFFIIKSVWICAKNFSPPLLPQYLAAQRKKITGQRLSEYATILVGFSVFFLSFRVLQKVFQETAARIIPNQNVIMVVSLLAFRKLSKVFREKKRYLFVAFAVLTVYIIYTSWGTFMVSVAGSLGRSLVVMSSFPLAKRMIGIYTDNAKKKTIPFAPWMFFGVMVLWFI